ncbi:MAG: hypothetical protein GKR89_10335 [Candidatus Latescibacteria bacterium]|nr:hypothetical protein [Candidatus Latescibacterota bacterium]
MSALLAEAAAGPLEGNYTCFVQGPAGAGKSQALIERLKLLLHSGVPGYSILAILPDRSTTRRYGHAVEQLDIGPFGAVELQTYSGLATRLVRLFWPLVAAEADFAAPQRPPIFLNYETAQYTMGQVVEPLLAQGYFEGLSMRPQRILSQLLDNLNKAAVGDFPLAEVGPRLDEAWSGDEGRRRYYGQMQHCVDQFRAHCLERGLLDFSLVVEVFHRHLVEKPAFWRYFTERYRHLLVDHLEESVPVAQDLVRRLLPLCDSALLACNPAGGLRIFLGVDPVGAMALAPLCGRIVEVDNGPRHSPDVTAFCAGIGRRLGQPAVPEGEGRPTKGVAAIIQTRYRAQMIDQVAQSILRLVQRGVPPGEIAVVAPHADGVLRFMLSESFTAAGIPFAVVRRFESLREEPVVRACLGLAALAHPQWGVKPPYFDVVESLNLALGPLDPVRTALVVRRLYDGRSGTLRGREVLRPVDLERIGFAALERYEAVRSWLETYQQGEAAAFDHFLRQLFGEILSGPELKPEDAAVYSKLIASASFFRQGAPAMVLGGKAVGHAYLEMIYQGVVAAQYLTDLDLDLEAAPESIALVAPIYTYLLSNRVSRFQFWLDIGSATWWEPLHQPLTNHSVLSPQWRRGEPWTDAADWSNRNRILFRLVQGLSQRCSEGIYLCTSELEGRGEPQDSPLLQAVHQVLQGAA